MSDAERYGALLDKQLSIIDKLRDEIERHRRRITELEALLRATKESDSLEKGKRP